MKRDYRLVSCRSTVSAVAVVPRLQHAGYTVDVEANPLRGLASDSAYLAAVLHSITGPIILVGHSYGGAVITDAATGNPNVKGLVYIDAFVPAEGGSVLQLAMRAPSQDLAWPGTRPTPSTSCPIQARSRETSTCI